MSVTRAADSDRRPPARASVRTQRSEYVVELDVSGFQESELRVEAVGQHVSVRGDRVARGDGRKPFRLHQRLEETFRLPDDAVAGRIGVFLDAGTLTLRVPRRRLERRRLPIEHQSRLIHAAAEAC